MSTGSRRLVVLALLANLGIAVTKFVAAGISGSAAMLAEAFHSVADTGNQVFVLRGEHASRFGPDPQHPFGRGKEIYFWSFLVAVVLFVGGAVLSVGTGIGRIRNPAAHEGVGLAFSLVVLAIAAFFELFVAFRPALKEFNRLRAGRSIPVTIREAKDPALLIVLFEDSAAVTGIGLAAAGLLLAAATGDTRWDGVASVLIGLLLGTVAAVLAVEMKSLLIGEAASREARSGILAAVYGIPEVNHVDRLLTMQLSPEEILVNMDVAFDEGLSEERLAAAIVATEAAIRAAVPAATRIFVEPVAR